MSTSQLERPATGRAGDGGAPARRAVVRWAWRLFRREWRQQTLILALLIVAVAATTAGLAIVANSRPAQDPTFGTANLILSWQGTDRHLTADIAAARKRFGQIDLIEHQNVPIPGSLNRTDLRAQDPHGPFGYPLLRLDAGRYPAGADQVAVTAGVAATYRLRIGAIWQVGGHARQVVGIVENPQNLLDNFALVAPGQVNSPGVVTGLLDTTSSGLDGFSHAGDQLAIEFRNPPQGLPAVGVLLFAAIGLLFVGLVAVAGFTVLAGRRLRALGMLGAVGATGRNIRLVMVVNGAIVGVTAALAGAAIGLAGWLAFVPSLETLAEHRVDAYNLPWWDIGGGALLAVVTAIAAAWWPARTAARVPVVAALSGRPPRPQPGHRFAALGGLILAAGLGSLAKAGHAFDSHHASTAYTVAGLLATAIGMLVLGPLAIRGLTAVGRRAPIAIRLALRDLVRYQARSGAALAAVALALGIAASIAISAAGAEASAAVPPNGGNLPPNQLMVYLSANESPTGTQHFGGGAVPVRTAAELHDVRSRIDALAGSLRARVVLSLDAAAARAAIRNVPPDAGGPGTQTAALMTRIRVTYNGRIESGYGTDANIILYVATPALLRHYGIEPGSIRAGTDLLTSSKSLAGYVIADFARQLQCPGGGGGCKIKDENPLAAPPGIAHPRIQRVRFSAYTSEPSTVITMHAVRVLRLRLLPAAWLLRTAQPLTAAQVIKAEHWAAASGLTVETRSTPDQQSLSRLATGATGVGILVALGVLAMTIGLIRSETATDLRTLTATGASGRTRRALTGATAGALALLGALLGVVGAYLALIAWNRGLHTLSHVPTVNLIVMLAGLPVLAAMAGWLLAGREPPAIARQPIE